MKLSIWRDIIGHYSSLCENIPAFMGSLPLTLSFPLGETVKEHLFPDH
jgi:hypothetical protein